MRGTRAVLLIGIVVGLLGGVIAFAQPPKRAPLNPKFVEFLQNLRAGKLPPIITKSGHYLGYIPPPFSLSQINKGKRIPVRQAFPARYDLRDQGRLSPVRNQDGYGTCWAHAVYGSLESCTITASGEVWDFSENNLVNWTADNENDPFDGDVYGWWGGYETFATDYLVGWFGPVQEADDPYPNPTAWSQKTVVKHVQEVLYLPDRSGPLDNDIIKQAVMQYGAVSTSVIYYDDYFNPSTNAYYSGGWEVNPSIATWGGPHAICIVGWDDNYPRTNFLTQPPGDGAFICRNSWGPWWGEGGYFYVSYYDGAIGEDSAVFLTEDVNNYTHIYQYDPLGPWGWLGYDTDTAWFANIFTATSDEMISAAGFYTSAVNSTYTIYVYTNVFPNQPRSGTLSGTKSGTILFPGYHTIRLDTPIPVAAGQKFSVVIKITTPGDNYPIPVEDPCIYRSLATSNPGESFVSADGVTWDDITTYYDNANVCVKAYTNSLTTFPFQKSVDKTVALLGEQLTYTIQYKNQSDHTLSNIMIEDVIPQNTEYVEGSATGNPTYDPQKKTLTWQIASLSPGSSISYSFKVKTLAPGDVANKATVTYQGLCLDSNFVTTKVCFPLSLTKSVNKTLVFINGILNYTLCCKNSGTKPIQSISITDVIPQNTEYEEGSATGNPTYDPQKKTLTWQIASLAGGAQEEVSFKVKVLGGEEIVNKATITYEGSSIDSPPVSTTVLNVGKEMPICTNFATQYSPSVFGDKIVWADNRNGNWDIYMYDLTKGQEVPICTAPGWHWKPSIYGDKIVWQDYRNRNWDIYMYDLTSGQEIPICTALGDQERPSICGDKIVWMDYRNGNYDIYMYDLSLEQEIPICTEPHLQKYPAIYGDKIVWADWRNGDADIYMYDLTTGQETPICTAPGWQWFPAIYGDKIVWVDERNGNADIYMYDLTTGQETPICTEPHDQEWPTIYGDKIVWVDWRNGDWGNGNTDIYMYDLTLGQEIPICTEPHAQTDQLGPIKWGPVIYGDKIVWEDNRNGNWDIYMYLLEKGDIEPPTIRILYPSTQGELSGPTLLIAQIFDLNLDEGSILFYLDGKELPSIYPYYPTQQFIAISGALSPGSHSFKVVASDAYGNQAEKEISFQVASEQVPPPRANVVFGGLPFQPLDSFETILSGLGFEKACIWNGDRYIFCDSIDFPTNLGHSGVWLKTTQPFDPSKVKPLGTPYPTNNEIIISIKKGWNAIRLPWSYSLPLAGLVIEDKNGNRKPFSQALNLVGAVLFRWDGTRYVSVGLQQGMENKLYPWFGYWIRAKDDCKLVLPKEPWNVKEQRASSKDGFCLPIKAVFSDGRSEEVYIGIGSKEMDSPFPPPSPYSPSERGLFLLKQGEPLYLDIRQKGGTAEWQLAVRGDATLLFPNLSSLPKGWQIILSDGGKRYYLKTVSSVKVEGEKVFKIEIGEKLTVPLVIGVLEARASRGGVNISWNVNLPCQTRILVKGMDGRVLRDLGVRSSSAGLNSLVWDGKDGEGRSLPAGIYIIELTARDEMNQMVKAIRGVIVR